MYALRFLLLYVLEKTMLKHDLQNEIRNIEQLVSDLRVTDNWNYE